MAKAEQRPSRRAVLFGYPSLYQGNREVKLESHKVRGLLTYLVHQRGNPVARDYLAYLLWPDMPNEIARKNLRQALYSLRKALGPLAQVCLDIQRDAVCLHPHPDLEVDVWHFEELTGQVQAHIHRSYGACPYCHRRYQAMLQVYQHEFLEGFTLRQADPFDNWAAEQREHYRQLALEAVRQVVRHVYLRGDWPQTEHWARRWLQWDPWSEEAYTFLMRVLALQGRKNAALQAYRRYVRMMREEMALEPSPAIRQLAYEIRQDLLQEPISVRMQHALPVSTFPLVGREKEKEYLLDRLAQPRVRLLAILGLGGQGKTRLAEAVAWEAIPLFPEGVYWVPLMGSTDPEDLLTRLHAALEPFLAVPRDWEGLRQALRSLRALLVLDDVAPHADTLLEWLAALLRESRDLTVLATARQPLQLRLETRMWLRGLRYPQGGVQALTPNQALKYPAVQLFVQRAQRANDAFHLSLENLPVVLEIVRFTQGLPLALELAAAQLAHASCQEVADALRRAVLDVRSPHRDQPPQHRSLRMLWESIWHTLSEEIRTALIFLASFQGAFDPTWAREIANVTPEQLHLLEQQGLIQPLGESGVSASTRWDIHPVIRAFVREKAQQHAHLLDQWRQQAHIWLRHHLVHLTLTQTEGVQCLYALQQALPSFVQELLQRASPRELVLSLPGLISWFRYRGNTEEGLHLLSQVEDRLEAWQDYPDYPWALGVVRRLQGSLYFAREELEKSLWSFQDATRLLQATPKDVHFLYALQGIAIIYELMGRLDEARHWHERARALCEEILRQHEGKPLQRELEIDLANALHNLGNVALLQGHIAQAEKLYLQAMELMRKHQAHFYLVNTLNNLAHLYILQGEWVDARQYAEESLRIARRIGALVNQTFVYLTLGTLFTYQQDWQAAYFFVRQSHGLAQRLGLHLVYSESALYLGIILDALGQEEEAEAFFRTAWHEAREYKAPFLQAEAALAYATYLMNHQRLRAAERWLREAMTLVLTHGFGLLEQRTLVYLLRLWYLQRRYALAVALHQWLHRQELFPLERHRLENWEKEWGNTELSPQEQQEAQRLAERMRLEDWAKVLMRGAIAPL